MVPEATSQPLPEIRGELVVLRAPRAGDAEPLNRILAEPAVVRWWGEHDLEEVRRETVGGEIPGWVIEAEGEVAGWIEFDEIADPRYSSVGLDIFVTTPLHGRGHAREAMRLAIEHFIARGHHRLRIDPAVDNERAIRAYAALGFQPVGVMRNYEREDDGKLVDGLLMDLLAEEFAGRRPG